MTRSDALKYAASVLTPEHPLDAIKSITVGVIPNTGAVRIQIDFLERVPTLLQPIHFFSGGELRDHIRLREAVASR